MDRVKVSLEAQEDNLRGCLGIQVRNDEKLNLGKGVEIEEEEGLLGG